MNPQTHPVYPVLAPRLPAFSPALLPTRQSERRATRLGWPMPQPPQRPPDLLGLMLHTWEGEGGPCLEPAPEAPAADPALECWAWEGGAIAQA